MDRLKMWLKGFWKSIKDKDLMFWSTLSTLLLVIITLFLAIATNKMANVMMLDFKTRNMPIFWTTTPKLETTDTKTKISFGIKNASDGIAKNAIHNVILEIKSGRLYLAENIIVKSGAWAKKLNQIPFEYVAKAQENIKLDWPKNTHPADQIKSLVIIVTYDTLFEDERQQFAHGYVYENSHNNFDPMTEDLLDQIVLRAKKEKLIQ